VFLKVCVLFLFSTSEFALRKAPCAGGIFLDFGNCMAMINFYGVFGLALVTRGGNVGRLLLWLWSWFVNLVLLLLLLLLPLLAGFEANRAMGHSLWLVAWALGAVVGGLVVFLFFEICGCSFPLSFFCLGPCIYQHSRNVEMGSKVQTSKKKKREMGSKKWDHILQNQ